MARIQTYSEKITSDWELDIEYYYHPAEKATHDYPGYGAHIEIERILLWHKDWKNMDNEEDMYDFIAALAPEWLKEIEEKIVDTHAGS